MPFLRHPNPSAYFIDARVATQKFPHQSIEIPPKFNMVHLKPDGFQVRHLLWKRGWFSGMKHVKRQGCSSKAFHASHTSHTCRWDAGCDARDGSHVQNSGVESFSNMMRFQRKMMMPSRKTNQKSTKKHILLCFSGNSWRFRSFMIGLQCVYKREALLVSIMLPFLPSMMGPSTICRGCLEWCQVQSGDHKFSHICHISAPFL